MLKQSLNKLRPALLILALSAYVTVGCNQHSSKLDDFVSNRNAKNVALLIGAPTNLTGVPTDIKTLTELFGETHKEFNFEVIAINRATKAQIIQATKEAAAKVGNDGTLYWYFSGHGASSGNLNSEDNRLIPFKEIAAAMASARTAPMRRLMVMIDSCFSGQMVNGNQAVSSFTPFTNATPVAINLLGATSAVSTMTDKQIDAAHAAVLTKDAAQQFAAAQLTAPAKKTNGGLAQELIVLSASQKNKMSNDMGPSRGGAFTYAFRQAWKQLREQNQTGATINDLLKLAQDLTKRGNDHTPQFEVVPADIGAHKLFVSDSGQVGGGGNSIAGPDAAIFIMPTAANANSGVYVSGAVNATRMVVCKGPRQQCMMTPTIAIELNRLAVQNTTRNIFTLPMNMTIQKDLGANTTLTFLAVDAQSKIVSARAVTFNPKP